MADEPNETQGVDEGQAVEDAQAPANGGDGGAADKVEKAGWGLFLIWVGIVLYTEPGWGVFLVGLGAIFLVKQVVRTCVGLKPECFWAGAGVVLVVIGLLTHYKPEIELFPIVLIVLGALCLISVLTGKCGCGCGTKGGTKTATKDDNPSCCEK